MDTEIKLACYKEARGKQSTISTYCSRKMPQLTLKTVRLVVVLFMVDAQCCVSSEVQYHPSMQLLVTKKGLDYCKFSLTLEVIH